MRLKRHVRQYAIAYLLMIVCVLVLQSLTGSAAAMSGVIPSIAALYPLGHFVKEFRREPTPEERTRLTRAFIATFLVIQAVLFAFVFATVRDQFDGLGGVFWLFILVGLLVPVVLIWLTVRFYPRMALRSAERAEARKAARRRS